MSTSLSARAVRVPPARRKVAGADRRFLAILGVLVVAGLVLRLLYALLISPEEIVPGDTKEYGALAQSLASGDGYTLGALTRGAAQPTASHPPLYPMYLAAFELLGLHGVVAHRVLSCLLGAAAVALIGLLGRRVGGPRTGLVAAGVAAVYPQLVMIDGAALADSLYVPLIVATLLAAYALLDRPSRVTAAALGLGVGLATLTRPEAVLLVLLLAVPVVRAASRRRLELLGTSVAVTLVVLSPWILRNWIVLDKFPLLATNGALTSAAANCRETYFTKNIGWVAHECALQSPCLRIHDEVPQSECFARQARAWVRDHEKRLPLVLLAREGRLWQVFGVFSDLGYQQVWGRRVEFSSVGLVMFGALAALAFGGAVLLRRRGATLMVLVAPFVLVSLAAALTFGFSRYRLAAEAPLIVLAAVALTAWFPERDDAAAGAAPERPARAT